MCFYFRPSFPTEVVVPSTNHLNHSCCSSRYQFQAKLMHPEIPSCRSTTQKSLKMGRKDHPFLSRNTYESGWMEQSLIKLLQCQETSVLNNAFLRSDVTPTIGMNGIKFQQAPNSWNMWMVLLSGFSYDLFGCIPVPRAKSLYGIKDGEGKTQFSIYFPREAKQIFQAGEAY